MKVAWILNGLVGRAGVLYSGVPSQSGGWINDAYNQFSEKIIDGTVDLHIVVPVSKSKKTVKDTLGGTYYFIECDSRKIGGKPTQKDIRTVNKILDGINPDCIMLWGSEYPMPLCASRYAEAHGIPLLLYVQGLAGSFDGKFNGNLPLGEMGKHLSLPDKIKLIQSQNYFRSLMKQKKAENAIIKRLYGVISDNEWCFSYVKKINPQVRCFKHFLPLNEIFLRGEWSLDKTEKNKLFTIAGRTAYKGLHNLIKALPAVKEQFPDVTLYIPGNMGYGSPAIIRRPPYIAYLHALIKECGVSDNVVFLGKLDPAQMFHHIESCACFVMPSMVEHQSTSLREAMRTGAPCVSSLVGCVGEFAIQDVSASVYECDDYQRLSREIIRILSDPAYAQTISVGAKMAMQKMYAKADYQSIFDIYKEVCNS